MEPFRSLTWTNDAKNTQARLRKDNLRLQHKNELHAVTAGILVTWNLLLNVCLFALIGIPMVLTLLIVILTLLLAIFTRKLVLKTPAEALASEEKKDE